MKDRFRYENDVAIGSFDVMRNVDLLDFSTFLRLCHQDAYFEEGTLHWGSYVELASYNRPKIRYDGMPEENAWFTTIALDGLQRLDYLPVLYGTLGKPGSPGAFYECALQTLDEDPDPRPRTLDDVLRVGPPPAHAWTTVVRSYGTSRTSAVVGACLWVMEERDRRG